MAGDYQRHGAVNLVDNPAGSDFILEEEVEFLPPAVCGAVRQSVEDALDFDKEKVQPDLKPIFDDYEVLGDPIFDDYTDDEDESQESEPIFEANGELIYDVYSKGGAEATPLFVKLVGEVVDFTLMEPSVVGVVKSGATTNIEENYENAGLEWKVEGDSFLCSPAAVRLERDFKTLHKKEIVGWLIYDPGKLESLVVQFFSSYCGGVLNGKMIDEEYYACVDSREIIFNLGKAVGLATKHFQKMVSMLEKVLEESSCVISSRSPKIACVSFGNGGEVGEKVVLDGMLMALVVKVHFDGQRLQIIKSIALKRIWWGEMDSLCDSRWENKKKPYAWLLGSIFVFARLLVLVEIIWVPWKYCKFRNSSVVEKSNLALKLFHNLGFHEHEIWDSIDQDSVFDSESLKKVHRVMFRIHETVTVKRRKIIENVSTEGLFYLHHGCVPPIMHMDAKFNDILWNVDYGVMVSGVAKIVDNLNENFPISLLGPAKVGGIKNDGVAIYNRFSVNLWTFEYINFGCVQVQQVIQPFDNDIIHVVGFTGGSQFNAYQISLKSGELLKHESVVLPGMVAGKGDVVPIFMRVTDEGQLVVVDKISHATVVSSTLSFLGAASKHLRR